MLMKNKVDQFHIFHGINKISMTTCSEDNAFVVPAAGELAPVLLEAYLVECERLSVEKQHMEYVRCLLNRVREYQASPDPSQIELIDCKFFFFATSIYSRGDLTQQNAFLVQASDPAVPPALQVCVDLFRDKNPAACAFARSYLEHVVAFQATHDKRMPVTNAREAERCGCRILTLARKSLLPSERNMSAIPSL